MKTYINIDDNRGKNSNIASSGWVLNNSSSVVLESVIYRISNRITTHFENTYASMPNRPLTLKTSAPIITGVERARVRLCANRETNRQKPVVLFFRQGRPHRADLISASDFCRRRHVLPTMIRHSLSPHNCQHLSHCFPSVIINAKSVNGY